MDQNPGLTATLARACTDQRDGRDCDHAVRELLSQRPLAEALGYDDVKDHDTLRREPLLGYSEDSPGPYQRVAAETEQATRRSSRFQSCAETTRRVAGLLLSPGTSIEVTHDALTAYEIATTAEFFSFGTNDLSQTCLGMSRDDSDSFISSRAELVRRWF